MVEYAEIVTDSTSLTYGRGLTEVFREEEDRCKKNRNRETGETRKSWVREAKGEKRARENAHDTVGNGRANMSTYNVNI